MRERERQRERETERERERERIIYRVSEACVHVACVCAQYPRVNLVFNS